MKKPDLLPYMLTMLLAAFSCAEDDDSSAESEDDEFSEPVNVAGISLACTQSSSTDNLDNQTDFGCRVESSAASTSRPDPDSVAAFWFVVDDAKAQKGAKAIKTYGNASADMLCRASDALNIGVMVTNLAGDVSVQVQKVGDISLTDDTFAPPSEFSDISNWTAWKDINLPNPASLRGKETEFKFHATGLVVEDSSDPSVEADISGLCSAGVFGSTVQEGDYTITLKRDASGSRGDGACFDFRATSEDGYTSLFRSHGSSNGCVSLFVDENGTKRHYVIPIPTTATTDGTAFREAFATKSGFQRLNIKDIHDISSWYACYRSAN